jgi:hypothetical protein
MARSRSVSQRSRRSASDEENSEISGTGIAIFVVVLIGVCILIWYMFVRKCEAEPFAQSPSGRVALSAEPVRAPAATAPAALPASATSARPEEKAPAGPDTSVLTTASSDSIGATSPQRAVAFQSALNADFGPGSGTSGVNARLATAPSNETYAAMLQRVQSGAGLDGSVVSSLLSSAGPRGSSEIQVDGADLSKIDESFAIFPKNTGMTSLQSQKQEDMMKMPQTDSWLMNKSEEDQKRAENTVRAALAAADPMRAAALTANMTTTNPVTLRAVLASQRGTVSVRPTMSRSGVSSEVAGPSLPVRMGVVPPAEMPTVSGEGLSVSTQIQDTVARFHRTIAAEAASCAK